MHGMGKNVKHYGADHVIWGTDCIWWGSPQWVIDAFKRFQISDEYCEKFGYKKIIEADKAKIFGRQRGEALQDRRQGQTQRAPFRHADSPEDRVPDGGGQPNNAAHGWVRADD